MLRHIVIRDDSLKTWLVIDLQDKHAITGSTNEELANRACEQLNVEKPATETFIDIVFDRPPGHDEPRFIEVENELHESINVGEWTARPDGLWALRIPR